MLMDRKFLLDSLSITWQQLNRANRVEMVHFLVESLPGALAWNVAHEILQKMNQRRICSLILKELKDILPTLEPKDSHLRKTLLSLTKEECDKIREYRQHMMEKSLPVWDCTVWSGNQCEKPPGNLAMSLSTQESPG
ncbi:NACHT, LRR and PYD domains-containing protein 8 [Lemmus lemmus]